MLLGSAFQNYIILLPVAFASIDEGTEQRIRFCAEFPRRSYLPFQKQLGRGRLAEALINMFVRRKVPATPRKKLSRKGSVRPLSRDKKTPLTLGSRLVGFLAASKKPTILLGPFF